MNALNDLLDKKADELFKDDDLKPSKKTDDKNISNDNEAPNTNTGNVDNEQLKSMIYVMKDQLDGMLRILNGEQTKKTNSSVPNLSPLDSGEQIVEGVFNGEKMVDNDGKEYSIPPNYISKSKMVEGDMLKLTITKLGSFVYKQIGPIDRKRITGVLVTSPDTGQWLVEAEGKTYKVIDAAVSFFKGREKDTVVLLIPQDGNSQWGAVENVINN